MIMGMNINSKVSMVLTIVLKQFMIVWTRNT